jgi:hypothetical protein
VSFPHPNPNPNPHPHPHPHPNPHPNPHPHPHPHPNPHPHPHPNQARYSCHKYRRPRVALDLAHTTRGLSVRPERPSPTRGHYRPRANPNPNPDPPLVPRVAHATRHARARRTHAPHVADVTPTAFTTRGLRPHEPRVALGVARGATAPSGFRPRVAFTARPNPLQARYSCHKSRRPRVALDLSHTTRGPSVRPGAPFAHAWPLPARPELFAHAWPLPAQS